MEGRHEKQQKVKMIVITNSTIIQNVLSENGITWFCQLQLADGAWKII